MCYSLNICVLCRVADISDCGSQHHSQKNKDLMVWGDKADVNMCQEMRKNESPATSYQMLI